MPYKPTRRQWVKLWVEEWLGGSTRFELTATQRAIFIDILAWGGRSRYPGIIATTHYGGQGYRGFPLAYLAGNFLCSEADLLETLAICAQKGKVELEQAQFDGQECFTIYICNWEKYQSEYLRQAKYRVPKTPAVTTKLVTSSVENTALEGEGEGEGEVRSRGKMKMKLTPITTAASLLILFSEEEKTALIKRFPSIDLEWEAGKCLDWHTSKKSGLKRPKLAFKNWLEKAGNASTPKVPAPAPDPDHPALIFDSPA